MGRFVARLAGIPGVHPRNGLYSLGQRKVKRLFCLLLEHMAERWTDKLIAVSESERRIVTQFHLAPALHVDSLYGMMSRF
jgi:hypothetical protein